MDKNKIAVIALGILIFLLVFGILQSMRGGSEQQVIPPLQPEPGEPMLGNANTPVLMEIYSDFECPFCGKAANIPHELLAEYPDKLKIVFRHFPLSSIHPYSVTSAEASECAADQGKFWEYHDYLFAHQDELDFSSLKRHAATLGLDTMKFNTCLETHAKASLVQAEYDKGYERGIRSTPTFLINGQVISGAKPLSIFEEKINSELAKIK